MFQCLDKARLASYSTLKHRRKSSLNFLDLKILDTAQAQSLRPTLIPGHKPAARKTEEHVTKYSVMKRSQGEISTGTTNKYSHHLWFHFTPAQLAAWYNERQKVEAILPPEQNGIGFSLTSVDPLYNPLWEAL